MVYARVMGFLVFFAGLITLVVAVLDTIIPIGIGSVERIILFAGGVIVVVLGYLMVMWDRG
jgi:hypothetical protein